MGKNSCTDERTSEEVLVVDEMTSDEMLFGDRKGFFEQGHDKLGHFYEIKVDNKGTYTKKEILKDGTLKLTIKKIKNINQLKAFVSGIN